MQVRVLLLLVLGALLAGPVSCSQTVAPSWSRDRLPVEGEILFLSDRDGKGNHLYLMNPDGTVALPRLPGEVSVLDAAWSHDGQTIAYTVELRYGGTDYGTDVYLLDRDGAGGWPLVTSRGADAWPRWSPDGERVAFVSDRDSPGPGIYLINVDGSDERLLLAGSFGEEWGDWSTTGDRIVAVADSTHRIRVIDVETKDITMLVTGYSPAFSPGDEWIAFHDRGIHLIKPDSTNLTTLTAYGDGFRWDPQGQWVSFRDTNPYTPYTLELVSVDGAEHRVLVENQESWRYIRYHSWSPDGQYIVFNTATTLGGGETALFVASLADSTVSQITTYSASNLRPEWRP